MKKFIEDVIDAMKTFLQPLRNRYVIVAIIIFATLLSFTTDAYADNVLDPTFEQIVKIAHTIEPDSPPILYSVLEESETNLYTEESHPDEYCIALNVYYEARADNLAGKYAVADVVMNRVNDSRFPNTVCEVIRQGIMYESWSTKQHKDLPDEERVYWPKRDRCQFSWFCDGLADEPENQASWRDAQIIAYNFIQFGSFRGITEGATHYHATYVSPSWSLVYQVVGRIGAHIFYRWV